MASYEWTKDWMMRLYSDLFPTSDHCLVQLFLVYGNGYHWEDGELVNNYDTPESEIIADREFYARLMEEHHARMEEALAHIDDQDLVTKMRAVMNESSEPMPLTLYPTSREYSAIFDVPDDVKPDWLEAIRAAINLVLSSAHTTRKPVDWFNPDKEVEKATEALGILNSRFNTGGNDET